MCANAMPPKRTINVTITQLTGFARRAKFRGTYARSFSMSPRLILADATRRELQQDNADPRHEQDGNPVRQIPLKIYAVHRRNSC